MRLRFGVFCLVLMCLVGVLLSAASAAGPGSPPPQCAPYEYLKSTTCLLQSRALTFTLTPKTLKPGAIVTAKAVVIFESPANSNGAAAVSWSWDSLIGILGVRQAGCGAEKGSAGLVSRCKFKVGAATGYWRTVTFPFSTYQGPAFSRDYFAVLGPGDVGPPAPPKPVLQKRKLATPFIGPSLPKYPRGAFDLVTGGNVPLYYPEGSPGKARKLYNGAKVSGVVIVETPANGGVVQVRAPGSPSTVGPFVVIGPGATVRLEAGKPIQVLAWTPGAKWLTPGQPYKVVIASAVLSARG